RIAHGRGSRAVWQRLASRQGYCRSRLAWLGAAQVMPGLNCHSDHSSLSEEASRGMTSSVLRWRSVGLLSLSALVVLLLLVKFGEPVDWFIDASIHIDEDVVFRTVHVP